MRRSPLVLAFILVVTGLAPATAVLGFCAGMPCCSADETGGGDALHGDRMAGCCTPISCYESPAHELTVSAKAKVLSADPAAALPLTAAPQAEPQTVRFFDDASPPPTTAQRLSSLSTFRI